MVVRTLPMSAYLRKSIGPPLCAPPRRLLLRRPSVHRVATLPRISRPAPARARERRILAPSLPWLKVRRRAERPFEAAQGKRLPSPERAQIVSLAPGGHARTPRSDTHPQLLPPRRHRLPAQRQGRRQGPAWKLHAPADLPGRQLHRVRGRSPPYQLLSSPNAGVAWIADIPRAHAGNRAPIRPNRPFRPERLYRC